jgi:diphthine methyl ester synthase
VYRFGEIISIPYFTEKWRPYSFYEKILTNRKNNLHTLLLLDIKVKERTEENLFKNKPIYEPPRFMDCKTCVE